MITSLKQDTTYLVVSFPGASRNNKESVDVIPRSWAFRDDGIWFSKYPDPVDYPKRDTWLKELKDPESDWDTYKITILKEARDHDQAVRRCLRSYKDVNNIESTDDSECIDNCDAIGILPSVLSKAARKSLLQEPIVEELEDSQERELISTPKSSRQRSPATSLRNRSTHTDVTENIPTVANVANTQKTREDSQQETSEVIPDNWKDYLDDKLKDLEMNIISAVKSAKRSVLYDIDKKINEVKNTIIVSIGTSTRGQSASSAREKLGTSLPIKDLDDFKAFEVDVSGDEEKKQSLKSLFTVLIAGSNSWKEDIGKMLNAIMSKAVQVHYSGCGRKVKGKGKLNFSQTIVFSCMKDVLEEHYVHIAEPLQLIPRVSRWLAGAGDREGGRLTRLTVKPSEA